jgi:hypothetical protein
VVPAVRSLGPAAVPLVSVALPFLAPYSNHAGGASSTFLVTSYDDGGMCATRTLLALPSEPQALASCVFHFWAFSFFLLSSFFLLFCVCYLANSARTSCLRLLHASTLTMAGVG